MKILFVESTFIGAYYFRRQLILELAKNNDLTLVIDKDEHGYFNGEGINLIQLPSDLGSTSILSNLRLKRAYKKIVQSLKPEVILTFTIKPNLYVSEVKPKTAFLAANITGLGKAFEKKGIINTIVVYLYRKAFKKCDFVFWQNEGIHKIFCESRIPINDGARIPGSGVDLQFFPYFPLNKRSNAERVFLFSARLKKEKGLDEFLAAAEKIKAKYPKTTFLVAGALLDDYEDRIKELTNRGIIEYRGFVDDLRDLYQKADCVVLPSFYKEGVSNVLLESMATGRPIITTNDIDGCRELIIESKTGYGVKSHSPIEVESAMERIISTPFIQLQQMSKYCRNFVEKNYDRNIVVRQYLALVSRIGGENRC